MSPLRLYSLILLCLGLALSPVAVYIGTSRGVYGLALLLLVVGMAGMIASEGGSHGRRY